MSTRSIIAIEHEGGALDAIYCRFDGYLSHHGPILLNSYRTTESVKALVALGDLEILRESAERCERASRPHNEGRSTRYVSRLDMAENRIDGHADDIYIWSVKYGRWLYFSMDYEWRHDVMGLFEALYGMNIDTHCLNAYVS